MQNANKKKNKNAKKLQLLLPKIKKEKIRL